MEKNYCICTEQLDWTAHFTQKMDELNQSSQTILGPVSARVAGFAAIPFVALAEASVHAGAALGKSLTGLVVSPYNCITDTFFPDYSLPQTLELSSAFVHLYLVIECICTAVLLPFLCLLNPSRADALINSRIAKPQEHVKNKLENQVDANDEVEPLQQNIKEQNEKLERAENRVKNRLQKREKELETANITLNTLRENNSRLADQLKNIPIGDNTNLLNRIAELEKNLKESKAMEDISKSQYESLKNSQAIVTPSKFEDSLILGETEKQKIHHLSNSATEMPRGAGRGKPNLQQIKKKQEDAKKLEEMRLKREESNAKNPKNNDSPKKNSVLFTNSGAVSLDQLQNVKLRSTSNLTQSKSQQSSLPLSNSQTNGLNSSISNFSSSQSNSTISLFQSGFVNYEKQNDLANGETNQNFEDFKQSCNDLHKEIKELEKGKFLVAHQKYLDKMSNSINMNQLLPSVNGHVERLTRWIEACEDKHNWQEPIDFSKSMIASGLNEESNNLNNSTSEELEAVINYFKEFKTALQNLLHGKQNSAESSEEIQKHKTESEEANRKAQIERLEERKKDLLRPLGFTFDMEANEKSLKWKTCFLEHKAFSNRDEFLVSLEKVTKAIHELQSEENEVDENSEYLRVKGMVAVFNTAFEKPTQK